ncbi:MULTISPECIES: alpha-L-fucosidase [Sphingobacterium]|uniref:alpha-L-fucosidase n=1 Tax=Sphingobacterium TaxID=28453 RepID=UPI00104D712F|nr:MULTISPECIES: alpha-L-fucosidase [Sphingobacterium]MCW2260191.1 alpha-L-fucosidase [Sphingobacterium kitahiroshimense]QQD13457.1 alpha-L-fucosidase [Sphingobacterium sp. UDSM-2020]TCR11020.1 alpha-L-fucosidase [Sphingobacterium sp. JUb78]
MKYFLNLLLLLTISGPLSAQVEKVTPIVKTSKVVIDQFMDLRFGMFIHWGPVALRGTEIGWSRGNQVPFEDYDQLHKEFNPVLFNAEEWVKTAKNSGMKYLTITAKHHDGFCLWPTKFSDLNIMETPFKRDVVGELAAACKKHGLKFCVYFTVLDWHDPHYPYARAGTKEINATTDMAKFVATMKDELTEILTNYDPYMLWFDGNWDKEWTDAHAHEVYALLKQLKPDVIINNRLKGISDFDRTREDHTRLSSDAIGDYATPEQKIGALNMDYPWESCMTIANQWAWKPNDALKSTKECIQTLAKTAAGNGNLLFNVGPMLDGRIEARQINRLKEMGDWLNTYGESIYGTKGGPFIPNNTYASTRKGNILYVHVFNRKEDVLTLPALKGVKVKKAHILNGDAITFSQSATGSIALNLPARLPNADNTVIVLELNKNAETIPVVAQSN